MKRRGRHIGLPAVVVACVIGAGAILSAATAGASLRPPLVAGATSGETASFYDYTGATPLASVPLGTVLGTRTLPSYSLAGVPVPLKVVQLLYRTTNALGQPAVNVTSVIKAPIDASTTKIVAYQSFYDSLNPNDGPSHVIDSGLTLGGGITNSETGLIAPFLLEGYDVIIADTEGETADFAAGPEYGMTTLDSIRAALSSSAVGVSSTARVGLIGYSGGAIATDWAAALAPSYAPDINKLIVGATEGGVLVDPAHNLTYIEGSQVWAGVLMMALIGASRAYHVDLSQYLNSYGLSIYTKLEDASIVTVLGEYPGLTWTKIAKPQYPNPDAIPIFAQTVNKLDLGDAPSPTVPMFIGQGANGVLEGTSNSGPYGAGDGVMIAGDVRSLARQYCASGDADIQYMQYDDTSHFTTVPLYLPTAIDWLNNRFAGQQAPTSCGSIPAGNSLALLPTEETLKVRATPGTAPLHHRTKVTIHVTVSVNGTVSPVPGASVLIGNGRHLHTSATGIVSTTLAYGRAGTRRVIATAAGYTAGTTTITVPAARAATPERLSQAERTPHA